MLSRDILVGTEVVDQSADDCRWDLRDVCHHSVYSITHENCNDLVVSLVMVQEPESSDRACLCDDISVGHIFLCKDTDIKRVAVTLYVGPDKGSVGKLCQLGAAIGSWEETV